MTSNEIIERIANDIVSRDVIGDLTYADVQRINDEGWTLDVGRPYRGTSNWLRIEDVRLSESDLQDAWERADPLLRTQGAA